MDDILNSEHTVQEAQELTTGIDKVMEEGGFTVKEWQSNKDLSNNGDQQAGEVDVVFSPVEDKVLGVVWNITEDSFNFKVKNEAIKVLNPTKSSCTNFRPHWICISLSDTGKDWITRAHNPAAGTTSSSVSFQIANHNKGVVPCPV